MTISNRTFDGLVFPLARVRYSGNAGRWNARIYRDRDRTYRASLPYDHATGGGARGALPAALKALEKALRDNIGEANVDDYVAVPGDLSGDDYAFTFVPARMLR